MQNWIQVSPWMNTPRTQLLATDQRNLFHHLIDKQKWDYKEQHAQPQNE